MFAGIIVNNESILLDKIFTYKVPEKLLKDIKIGQLVKIPFGKSNKLVFGFVYTLKDTITTEVKNIKEIYYISEKNQLFTLSDIKLIEYIKKSYLSTYLEAIKLFIPPGIITGVKAKTKIVLYTSKALEDKYSKEPYITIYNFVRDNNGTLIKSEIASSLNLSISPINTMIKHGFLSTSSEEVTRYNVREYDVYEKKQLNEEQLIAVNEIINSKKNMFLLNGITGSGKTEVYMNLVEHYMKNNKSSIILVPEISLTPQMVERFKGRFGKDIAIFHSKLSDGERYDEWFRVKQGKVKLAIGARSAIFLPFSDLGLIVIDEEHESSYKSDSDPKYHVRDIAKVLSYNNSCKVVLGSATPSIESFYHTYNGEYQLINLKNRVDGATLPLITLIDMREELANNNRSVFSKELFEEINLRLAKKEQIILFLNRRGFSTFVSCRKCGYVFKCPNCDISLTYHNSGNLICHYCGHRERSVNACPSCKSKYVKYFGIGTEKLENEIKRYFPKSKTLRMDFDTTRKKNSYEEIYNTFKKGEADILLGTQMIAKGLDFPNVTLVGVISADLSLNLPDYRAAERTYQLITQVAGRAGRRKKLGKVIVQTYTPQHYSLQYAKNYDYLSLYNEEIKIREAMNNPPFSRILSINLSSENERVLINKANEIGIKIKEEFKKDEFQILGPSPSIISKIKKMFRWQIIIKGIITDERAADIKNRVYDLIKDVYSDIRINIDINPNSLL
ncbi:replication restart DNA helicase PriA [Clostridium amylolyticum]|uniref:Replication restart protein PriA n=1 Tax=Clostridium amylolyticum TaxID=1121298 RepID=A0A1M6D511_9CLOT|nr:primosomal protein N' [Clostridium amylolyticum]SHI68357.1 replication restart DNA helicase PriA [Clostridium amylolyticum]